MVEYYNCILSKRVKIITLLGSLIILFLILITFIHLLIAIKAINIEKILCLLFIEIMFITLYALSIIFSPRFIYCRTDYFELNCFFYLKRFFYAEINSCKRVYLSSNDVRLFGSNGIWGYIGYLDNGQHRYYSFANNEKELLEIEYRGRFYLISCENSLLFQKTINEKRIIKDL